MEDNLYAPPLLSDELLQALTATVSCIGTTNGIIESFFEDEGAEDIDMRSCERPGRSNRTGRKDYDDSTWGRMLRNERERLLDSNSEEAKTFRLRFRVPFKMFEILLDWTTDWLQGREKESDCTGRARVPVSLKLLGVLRILGRGTCLDGIKELADMSETTMWKFFHSFCAWFRREIYPIYVRRPTTHSEIAKAMGPYAALGLMGAIGSTDAVHIHWGCCPSSLKILHTGKEGFPTLAYNVTGKTI